MNWLLALLVLPWVNSTRSLTLIATDITKGFQMSPGSLSPIEVRLILGITA